MIKIRPASVEGALKRGHDYLMVIVRHATATPAAVASFHSPKHGREAAKCLNALKHENYPRYICVPRNSCYFERKQSRRALAWS